MTTSCNAAELLRTFEQTKETVPPMPTLEERKTNPTVTSIATAGGPGGMLVNFQTGTGIVKLSLNPVIALQFLLGVYQTQNEIRGLEGHMNLISKKATDVH